MNNTWKDGWFIFKKDFMLDRWYFIWNVLFMLYIALMISAMVNPHGEGTSILNSMADFMFLTLIPTMGFYFSRRSFNYIKEDSYTRMLHYYRTFPIPNIAIMKGRVIQLIIAMIFNAIIFYPVFYLFSRNAGGALHNAGQLGAFALTWTGYGLLINGAYIYLEFLNKGRKYLWISFVLLFSTGFLAFVVRWFGGNLLLFTLEQSVRYSLLSPLMWGALIVGGTCLALFCKITLSKLGKRDLI
ncbi:hypothetical protein ACE3MQ_22990 [Paenibacillus lentus]|uniref:hypothetical protein n=1 Tax=Paenibacillus lentus TaxID=1338368 RepID=UPI003661F37A